MFSQVLSVRESPSNHLEFRRMDYWCSCSLFFLINLIMPTLTNLEITTKRVSLQLIPWIHLVFKAPNPGNISKEHFYFLHIRRSKSYWRRKLKAGLVANLYQVKNLRKNLLVLTMWQEKREQSTLQPTRKQWSTPVYKSRAVNTLVIGF